MRYKVFKLRHLFDVNLFKVHRLRQFRDKSH